MTANLSYPDVVNWAVPGFILLIIAELLWIRLTGRGGRYDNPIHLNDVQPVPGDGPYWKRGDLFLSIRNQSILMLYRPSTDEILWWQEGPWSHQHDVDVLDDHRISVFDNRMYQAWPGPIVDGHSGITVYDFDTGETSRPWEAPLAALELTSETEGLHTVRPNGDLFVEEQNRARIFELDPEGAVIWCLEMNSGVKPWRLSLSGPSAK